MTNKHQLLPHADPTVGVCWRLLENVGVCRGSVQAALEGAFSGEGYICEKSLVITFTSTLRTSSDLNSWRSCIRRRSFLTLVFRSPYENISEDTSENVQFFFFSIFKKIYN